MAKNKTGSSGIVYSTDPSFKSHEDDNTAEVTLAPEQQKLRIILETKQRAGKAVTLIVGFEGTVSDAELLGKKLKAYCGTGGSVKHAEIIVQGDNREKVLTWLHKNGYKLAKKSG